MTAFEKTQQPLPVELQLVQPFIALGRFCHQRGELRLHKLGHRGLPRAGEVLDLFEIHVLLQQNPG